MLSASSSGRIRLGGYRLDEGIEGTLTFGQLHSGMQLCAGQQMKDVVEGTTFAPDQTIFGGRTALLSTSGDVVV